MKTPQTPVEARARELPKPCPFCDESHSTICRTRYLDTEAFTVSCLTRDCHGAIFSLGYGLFSTEAEAIAAWNTRPALKPDPVPGVGEVAKRALALMIELAKIEGNKPTAFTLEHSGPLGTVMERQFAAICAALAQPAPEAGGEDYGPGSPWSEGYNSGHVAGWRRARQAPVAGREPTEAMIEAGYDVLEQADEDMRNYVSGVTTDWDYGMEAEAVWRAMWDAALIPPSSEESGG